MMTKISIVFLAVLALASVPAQSDIPFSETVEISNADDLYSLELTLPVYVKKGSTYELEEQTVRIEIAPRDWIGSDGSPENKEYFSKIFVSIVFTENKGRISKDFESYLNCELEDCDQNAMKKRLFWDHAGEERGDKAGESFDQETPLVVGDAYLELTMRPSSFFAMWSPFSPYESDVECILLLEGLTLEVIVDYSSMQRTLRISLEEASDHVVRGDEFFETEELDQARHEYEEAKTIYDQWGDITRSGSVQEKIVEIDLLRISAHTNQAEEYFEQEEYEKAREEFQNAKDICDPGDTEKSGEIQERINACNLYLAALESLEEGIQVFEEAETAEYDWRAENKYKEAKSCFEKARTVFDQVQDAQKSDECTTWINRCDEELGKVGTKEVRVESSNLVWYSMVIVIVVVGVLVIIIVLRRPAAKGEEIPKEPDELRTLKNKLVTGEISVEEYEKLKSALENARMEEIPKEPDELKALRYRLAAGEITMEEYEKLKSVLENE